MVMLFHLSINFPKVYCNRNFSSACNYVPHFLTEPGRVMVQATEVVESFWQGQWRNWKAGLGKDMKAKKGKSEEWLSGWNGLSQRKAVHMGVQQPWKGG